jgi:cell surface protein SprA
MKYSETNTYSEIYRYNDTTDVFDVLSPVYGGSLEMSYISLQTAFWKDTGRNVSKAFEQLKTNRTIIKSRLDAEDQSKIGSYGLNSQQVLIPAFLAAYTNADAGGFSNNPIPKFPLPNWKVDWNGLSRTKFFKKKFSSISISHSYASTYRISSYTSSLDYEVNGNGELKDGAILDTNSAGEYKPVLIINDIRIQEKFSPLIGINIRTRKNMSFKIAYNRSRDLGLNMSNSQLTEVSSEGFTFGFGYTKKKFRIPILKKKGQPMRLPNSITFKVDVTMRDTRTIQRSLVRNVDANGDDLGTNVVTSGNLNWQIRPVINYIYNKRVNIQFFFERTINLPRISSSYRRTSSAGGIKIRFSMT